MNRLGPAIAAAALAAIALAAAPAARAQDRTADGSIASQTTSDSRIRASKPSAKAVPVKASDVKITPADKARGAKEAPALLAASDVKTCQLTDSAFRGQGTGKDADGKALKSLIYEVACQTGPGYMIVANEGAPKPQTYNCVGLRGSNTACALPQNIDDKVALAGYVRQTGRTCDISGVRYMGTSPSTGQTFYEVGCTGAPGFVLSASESEAKPPQAADCLSVMDTPQACQLTTKPQMLAAYQPAVSQSGRTCAISDVRQIGANKTSGDLYTEIGCSSAPGFVLIQTAAGAYKGVLDCGKADSLGGCRMTDTSVTASTDNVAYTKLAAKAGFTCDVAKYRFIGTDSQNREVVELACKNRPDGAMAALSDTGKSDIYDCARAGAVGQGQVCKLTDPSLVYPKYTEALAAKGRSTCKVSGTSFLGVTTAGTQYVETACADGAPGWVIGFKPGTTTADELLTCKQASNSGLPCKLPGNTAANKG